MNNPKTRLKLEVRAGELERQARTLREAYKIIGACPEAEFDQDDNFDVLGDAAHHLHEEGSVDFEKDARVLERANALIEVWEHLDRRGD